MDTRYVYSSKAFMTLLNHPFKKIVERLGAITILNPDNVGVIFITASYYGNAKIGSGYSVQQALDNCWENYLKAKKEAPDDR